ncbi:uncharacterized protein DUF982 [Rhizobium sp. BK251]|nr:uncharacterized protein DUF982 [Rhizobium sp. BK251]
MRKLEAEKMQWSRPLLVELFRTGGFCQVHNAEEAEAWLRHCWPVASSGDRLRTLEICRGVSEGRVGAEVARDAFLAAAIAAGIRVVE